MKNPFEWIAHKIADRMISLIGIEISHYIFSAVGIESLNKIVIESMNNRLKKGHCDYMSLAKLYVKSIEEDLK